MILFKETSMKKIKKTIRYFVVALGVLFVALFLIVFMGEDISDELIGSWMWLDEPVFVYTFNADGTGSRGTVDVLYEEFEWHIRRGTLHLQFQEIAMFGYDSESWNATINNNRLRLESREDAGIFHYVRQSP